MNWYFDYNKPDKYITGDSLPYLRGVLHMFIAFFILLTIITVNKYFFKLLPLIIFLYGKFISYSASAILHSGLINTVKGHYTSLLIDKMGVYISVFVSGIPFLKDQSLYYILNAVFLIIGFTALFLNYETLRRNILIMQLIFVFCYVGNITKWNKLIIFSIILYILSFIIFTPCAIQNRIQHKMCDINLSYMFHKKGYTGCHEDFHMILFVADIFMFVNAIYFMKRHNLFIK